MFEIEERSRGKYSVCLMVEVFMDFCCFWRRLLAVSAALSLSVLDAIMIFVVGNRCARKTAE